MTPFPDGTKVRVKGTDIVGEVMFSDPIATFIAVGEDENESYPEFENSQLERVQ